MNETASIISLIGQIITIVAIIIYVTGSGKKHHTTAKIDSNDSHDKRELGQLISQIKQLEYVYINGFIDDKEYKETKDKTLKRIKQLKGLA